MNILKKAFIFYCLFGAAYLSIQCKVDKKEDKMLDTKIETKSSVMISKEDFGLTSDNTKVDKFILKNDNGMEVSIITYGGIITSLKVPNKKKVVEDVVLGFDSLEQYLNPEYIKNCPFFGALIGRYGNRIAKGKFSLDGIDYMLATNDGKNHLHGGAKGFDKVVWSAVETKSDSISASLVFKLKNKRPKPAIMVVAS